MNGVSVGMNYDEEGGKGGQRQEERFKSTLCRVVWFNLNLDRVCKIIIIYVYYFLWPFLYNLNNIAIPFID